MRPLSFFVLGHRGMLGHTVARYLKQVGHTIMTTGSRYTGEPDDPIVAEVVASRADVIVNCAAITPQRGALDAAMFTTNTLLPLHLAAALSSGQLLIHPSTDCVFDGRRGGYSVTDAPNAQDPYGLSKRLAEFALADLSAQLVVLRTSIVGPELTAPPRGLLGWFLAQDGPVTGWTDHRWNGITTLAWAQLCLDLACGAVDMGPGLHHAVTQAVVSKYELLRLFGETFDRRNDVRPAPSRAPVDRSLIPTHVMPPLDDQLRSLREWMQREV